MLGIHDFPSPVVGSLSQPDACSSNLFAHLAAVVRDSSVAAVVFGTMVAAAASDYRIAVTESVMFDVVAVAAEFLVDQMPYGPEWEHGFLVSYVSVRTAPSMH